MFEIVKPSQQGNSVVSMPNISPETNDRKDTLADFPVIDSIALSRMMMRVAEKSQTIVRDFLTHPSSLPIDLLGNSGLVSLGISSAFLEMTQRLINNPSAWAHLQLSLWQEYGHLWQQSTYRLAGGKGEPVIRPARNDRRFRDHMWDDNPIFDFIKQSYLISTRWLCSLVHEADNIDEQAARKIDFYTRQLTDALAPTNFILTNPEVLRATIDSGGKNLILGMNNLLSDLERGCGQIKMTMSDDKAFEIGDNVATTAGKVIWRNDLIELIHYSPSQSQTYTLPLLIIPPWINKYYILDLRPENSFIRWAVERGYAVFAISWVNPDEKLADKNFEDYLSEGFFTALDQVLHQTGAPKANVLGYCLGGTLLACGLAVMASRQDSRVHAATFLTSLLDFSQAGDLLVFIDDEQIRALELSMKHQGYLSGHKMATAFNMLRANDLIWSFFISNYLLGAPALSF